MGKQSCYHLTGYSGVAQLAERRTVNPQVVGSIPTPGAAKGPQTKVWGHFLFCLVGRGALVALLYFAAQHGRRIWPNLKG